jgi:hypothetical protein
VEKGAYPSGSRDVTTFIKKIKTSRLDAFVVTSSPTALCCSPGPSSSSGSGNDRGGSLTKVVGEDDAFAYPLIEVAASIDASGDAVSVATVRGFLGEGARNGGTLDGPRCYALG